MATSNHYPVRRISELRCSFTRDTALAVLLLCIALFHLITMREGYSAGDDAAMYIIHARNLVEGRAYADPGYIQNPYFFHGPKAYPLGFPLLLAPIIATFGLDWFALKVAMTLLFLVSLLVVVRLFRDELPLPYLSALIVVVGLNPFLWQYRHFVLSDIPFLLFVYLSLLGYKEAQQKQGSTRSLVIWALVAGFSTYYSILTRTVGLVLLPCFLIYDLICFRRLSRALLLIVTVCALSYGVQQIIFAANAETSEVSAAEISGATYVEIVEQDLGERLSDALLNAPVVAAKYARYAARIVWGNGYSEILALIIFVVFAVPVAVGFGYRLMHRFSVLEVFSLIYMASLLPWTFRAQRYLIPLIPLYYFYLFVGIARLQDWAKARARQVHGFLLAACLLLIAGTYVARYSTLDYSRMQWGFSSPAGEAFTGYVRAHTDPQDVFIIRDPRGMLLFTGRPASVPHKTQDEEELFRYFQAIDAKYLVVGPFEDAQWLDAFAGHHPDRLKLRYANSKFQLYRID